MCTTCTKEMVIGPQLGSKCELSRGMFLARKTGQTRQMSLPCRDGSPCYHWIAIIFYNLFSTGTTVSILKCKLINAIFPL